MRTEHGEGLSGEARSESGSQAEAAGLGLARNPGVEGGRAGSIGWVWLIQSLQSQVGYLDQEAGL